MQDLCEPNHILKRVRQAEPVQHIMDDGAVSDLATLAILHHVAGDIAIFGSGELVQRGWLWEGLKTKLATKAVLAGTIPFKGFFTVPYRP